MKLKEFIWLGALDTAVASGDITTGDHTPLSSHPGETPIDSAVPDTALTIQLLFPSKPAIYNGGCVDRHPEIIIIGDSIIRYVELPGAITYCLPGSKVVDIIELTPVLTDLHPSAHTIIVHIGTNDVMDKHSVKLHNQLESLAVTIQSLGKTCIFSGPFPTPSKSPERFSRLYILHEWLKTFCTATRLGFISNFDYFWTRHDLYKSDGLHPNTKGVKQLTKNIILHIAFNSD